MYVLLEISLVHGLLTFYFYCIMRLPTHIVVVFVYYAICVVGILQSYPRECSSLETHEVTKLSKWQTTARKLRINASEERTEFACEHIQI